MPSIYIAATLGLMLIYIDASRAGLIPIYIVASRAGLTPILIYTLAMLGIYMLIKGVLKAQCCSFTSLNLVLPTAATLWL